MAKTMKTFISKNKLIKIALLLFLVLMLVRPIETLAGATSGLLLWFEAVLPNLLPFIIISGLIIRLQITRPIGALFYPFLKHILPVTKEGCYPIFIGFLSGLPVGAKTSADMVESKRISLKEGQFLASMCNNASPMFILGYIAMTKIGYPKIGAFLCIIIYTSSIISTKICYHFYKDKITSPTESCLETHGPQSYTTIKNNTLCLEIVDEAILSGFEVVTKVGGYIILFSVLASIVESFGFLSLFSASILTGILEITVGIHNISYLAIDLGLKIVLITTITAFGGLSGLAQTKSVIGVTGLSIKFYFITKILCAFIAFILSSIYVMFFI